MKYLNKKLTPILLILFSAFVTTAQQNTQEILGKSISLNVTVWNEKGFLKDLSSENFEIYVEKKRQQIISFEQNKEPISVGFVIDTSASMSSSEKGRKLNKTISAVKGFDTFLKNSNPANDFFIITFGKSVNLLLETTSDYNKVREALDSLVNDKLNDMSTHFYDALKISFEKISNSKHQKKVLILVTDGQDISNTKLVFSDLEKLTAKQDVMLYIVSTLNEDDFRNLEIFRQIITATPIFERDTAMIKRNASMGFGYPSSVFLTEVLTSIENLEILFSNSGGRNFYPISQEETDEVFEVLANELKSQYRLEFKPDLNNQKNQNSKIDIKINLAKEKKKEFGRTSVRTKKRFYF